MTLRYPTGPLALGKLTPLYTTLCPFFSLDLTQPSQRAQCYCTLPLFSVSVPLHVKAGAISTSFASHMR